MRQFLSQGSASGGGQQIVFQWLVVFLEVLFQRLKNPVNSLDRENAIPVFGKYDPD